MNSLFPAAIRRCDCAWLCLAAVLFSAPAGPRLHAAPPVSEINAVYRHGQVFLTWREAATPPGTTFNVYVAGVPIRDVEAATHVAHHIEAHSAMDWWKNPAAMTK